jgi:hypothetical protein
MYHAGQTKNELLDEIDINAIQRERGKGGLPEHRNGGRWKHRSDSKNDRNVERLDCFGPKLHYQTGFGKTGESRMGRDNTP